MPRARYVLTARAAADLREARAWSRARWGKELTSRYFDDLHEGAQFIAENQSALRPRQELSAGTSLWVYPVREHYIVYEPLAERFIAVVAVIRQGRGPCARNVTSSDWVCQECALVWLGRGLASAASG